MRLAPILLLLGSCVADPRPPPIPRPATVSVNGQVTYERRVPSLRGLSRATETHPARRVRVEALSTDGRIVSQASTDDLGRFELPLAEPGPVTVRAVSAISADGLQLSVVRSPGDRRLYSVGTTSVVPSARGTPIAIHATVGGEEPAGAFHITDRLLDGARAVHRTVGGTLPPLVVLWRRGNTRSEAHTSFFRGEDLHQGAFELQLMGGEPGREDESDSDQFDSAIILHEFGHFVTRAISADPSIAGTHDRLRHMVPGVAWDEAFATFFACAVLEDPQYLDTVGVEPHGHVRMNENMENSLDTNARGVGTEATAFEILWDLADGTPSLPDRDSDGIAIGFEGVMRIVSSFERDADDYPYVGLFLERAVALGLLASSDVVRLTKSPRVHNLTWPLSGSDVWPRELSIPGQARGLIDGVSSPQPSGGPPDPYNGADAVHVYRFRIPRQGRIRAELVIEGTGRVADRQDLDLELYSINTDRIARAATESQKEVLDATVGPGSFVLYVRDGGRGNRAAYQLTLE